MSGSDPDEVRVLLLQLAATSAREPQKRALMAGWFRAALELLDTRAPPVISPAVRIAAQELAHSLGIAAEHAEALAEGVNASPPDWPLVRN